MEKGDKFLSDGTVIAMIPARMGSERLRMKNLVMLGDEPMIGHIIRKAKESGVFDRVVVNADHPVFNEIANRYDVEFYFRDTALAASTARSDDVVYDFMQKYPGSIVAWVNPISPLQPAEEIAAVVRHFTRENLDSLITVRRDQVHCNFEGEPLNYSPGEKFARTQDLDPVERFIYSIMMWRSETFVETYKREGYALLCGKIGFYPVSWLSSIIVKYEEDIRLCEYILNGMKTVGRRTLEYYPVPGGPGTEG
jgi:CMP-N-acetylneuraminic acid synthetase